jgi:uncharacterized membrane protein YraQ (UPF0718 family)
LPDLATIFISIVLQSLPFILVGVLAAAVIEVYVPEGAFARWMPRRWLPAVVLASLFGLVAPVCDCGAIPFARRLVAKGLPVYAAVTFIVAAPVVNPVVALATAVAFQWNWRLVALRLLMSLSVAVAIGFLGRLVFPGQTGLAANLKLPGEHAAEPDALRRAAPIRVIQRANADLFDIIFYVVLGALFTAATQTLVPRFLLNSVGSDQTASLLVMMPLATILSLCSEADAFVARAFAGSFAAGSLLAFMVIGQIVDLRNGLLLFRTLRAAYVLLIIGVSYVLVFVEALVINIQLPRP